MSTTPELRQPQSHKVTCKISSLSPDQPYYTFEVNLLPTSFPTPELQLTAQFQEIGVPT